MNSTLVNGVRRSAGIGAEFVEDTLWVPFIAKRPHVVSGTKAWSGGVAMARHGGTFARMFR